jgi:hypothetical protein
MMKIKYLFHTCVLISCLSACTKVDYSEVQHPAYLRVFNDLNLKIGLENKDEEKPFLTMLIDPVMDEHNIPGNAAIIGDFLDQRAPYAPPYPSHAGTSNSVNNPEYPGKETVLVGPVLNGFDLSSWAQVPAGTHRFVFCYRPTNSIPFVNLESSLRSKILLDTTITFEQGEVYTMHVLQQDFLTKEPGLLMRKEVFHKIALSDSMVYVNFYNYSAAGFWQADDKLKKFQFESGVMGYGLRDEMNVWISLCKPGELTPVNGYKFNYLGQMRRDVVTDKVSPYYSFPLFAEGGQERITTNLWQRISFLAPGIDPEMIPHGDVSADTDGAYGLISCYGNGSRQNFEQGALFLPNMIVNIHSGVYNPRSFATVNTIEVVNGNAYLMTVQRKYPPPVY